MPKFRKRPVVVEAFLINYKIGDGSIAVEWPQWFRDALHVGTGGVGGVYMHSNGRFVVHTLEGPLEISPGDYVIQGVVGEIYACKPDIFAKTYEPYEECSVIPIDCDGTTPGTYGTILEKGVVIQSVGIELEDPVSPRPKILQ